MFELVCVETHFGHHTYHKRDSFVNLILCIISFRMFFVLGETMVLSDRCGVGMVLMSGAGVLMWAPFVFQKPLLPTQISAT